MRNAKMLKVTNFEKSKSYERILLTTPKFHEKIPKCS